MVEAKLQHLRGVGPEEMDICRDVAHRIQAAEVSLHPRRQLDVGANQFHLS